MPLLDHFMIYEFMVVDRWWEMREGEIEGDETKVPSLT